MERECKKGWRKSEGSRVSWLAKRGSLWNAGGTRVSVRVRGLPAFVLRAAVSGRAALVGARLSVAALAASAAAVAVSVPAGIAAVAGAAAPCSDAPAHYWRGF